MRTLYAVHLDIDPSFDERDRAREGLFATAAEYAKSWSSRVVGAKDSLEPTDGWRDVSDGRVKLVDRQGDAGRLIRLDLEHPDRDDDSALRTATVWVADPDEGQLAVRVRLGLQHRSLADATGRHEVARPRLVRDLIDDVPVVADGVRLTSEAPLLSSDDVYELADLIFDSSRSLPIIVITPAPDGRSRLPAGKVAEELAGAAHVVELASRPVNFTFTEQVGQDLTAFNGAVRLLWPGARRDDDPRRHPLVLPHRVNYRTVWWLQRAVMTPTIATFGLPQIERRLAIAEAADRHGVTADDEWLADYEAMVDDLAAKEDELAGAYALIEELQGSVDDLRAELERTRSDFKLVQAAAAVPDKSTDDRLPPPADLVEAVERAAARCPHLVFLSEAIESAEACQAEIDPQRVLDDLVSLEAAAQTWASQGLRTSWEQLMADAGLSNFVKGITGDAERHYESDYVRAYKGGQIELKPHLKYGTRQRFGLRIYWGYDDEDKVFVIGHVGEHLGGRSVDG